MPTSIKTPSKPRKTAAARKPQAGKVSAGSPAKAVAKRAGKTPAKADKPAKKSAAASLKRPAAKKRDPVESLRQRVLAALDDMKARDVSQIDVRDKTSFADLLIVASGTSTRHVKSLADEVVKSAKRSGMLPLGVEGQREAEWVLVDLGDIVVHLMLPRVREFYGLERLWNVGEGSSPALA